MSDFVICIDTGRSAASLIVGKVYRTLPDRTAAALNLVRVRDEDLSERDGYLYPATMFVPIELPAPARQALASTGI